MYELQELHAVGDYKTIKSGIPAKDLKKHYAYIKKHLSENDYKIVDDNGIVIFCTEKQKGKEAKTK